MASGRLLIPSWMPALDGDGNPIPNARVYFYTNLTTTLAPIFADEGLTTPLTNPVLANSSGRFPAVWADEDVLYSWSVDAPYGPAGIPFTGDDLSVSVSAEVLVLEAIEAATGEATNSAAAAAASAAEAQEVLDEILEFAANSPEAPSIANKVNRDGDNAASDFLENVLYTPQGTGSVPRSQKSKNDDVLNAADFLNGVSGSATQTKLQQALANAILTGRKLILPPGTYQASGLQEVIDTYLPYAPAYGAGIDIEGAGPDKTILDNRQANGFLFDFTTDTAYKFMRGGSLKGFTITSTVVVANSSGIQLNRTFNFTIENVVIDGLSGGGMKWKCEAGDADGNVNVRTVNLRILNCKGWGWDGAAGNGFNENSFLSTQDVFVQNCGTAEEKAITGITQANPAVVTSAAHGRVNGDIVYIAGVLGMSEVNTGNSERAYVVAGATTNTFQLTGVNSTGYGSYTSGGYVISARPKSGGVRWKGQISRHDNLAMTVNENVSLYVEPGPATAQGLDLSGVVIENPKMVGAIIGGIDMMKGSMGQSYANAAQAGKPCFFGYMFDGTTDSIQAVDIDKHTVRITADNPDYVQWAQCGTNVVNQTIRINNTRWKDIGYSRQKRFTPSFQFDSVQDDTELVVINSGSAVIRPKSDCSGNKIPVRLRYAPGGNVPNGEWVARTVASIAVAPVGGAAATYNVYTYDDSNAVVAELSTTGYVTDAHGYRVKSDDPTRLFKGRVRTNGSGGFETTNLGWLNPLLMPGPQTGVPAWMWFSTADRTLRIKNSVNMPSQVDDSTYVYYSDNEIFTSSNVVVTVPAGPGGVFTTTITGTSLAVGDYIFDVQTPVGLGNFAARGTVNTAGQIQIIFWDPSNTGGSLNGGTAVRIQVTARRR